jgi:excisionase family DNA binding protein
METQPQPVSATAENHADACRTQPGSAQHEESLDEVAVALNNIFRILSQIQASIAGQQKPWLTVNEVAQYTGRTAFTIRRWISNGLIEAKRLPGAGQRGRFLIASDELTRLLSNGSADWLQHTAAKNNPAI